MATIPMSAGDLGIDYRRFTPVFVFASGKGGVGKTTLTGNNATKTAAEGIPTLAIDANGQGNLRREFGIGEGDGGKAFVQALRDGTPLVPVKTNRPNLDVVLGGKELRAINAVFMDIATASGPIAAFCRLAQCLQPLLSKYGVIWIDAPPENPNVLTLCLCASRWLVTPVKMDVCSLEDALKDISDTFKSARAVNPLLQLLGVVHFGSPSGATSIHREVVTEARRLLGNSTHVFEESIHASPKSAKLARELGLSVWELEQRARDEDKRMAEQISNLAGAHNNLTTALLRQMRTRLETTA
ncbi:ParA family protein [Streptomyces sp. NPDC058758]|uniref:ParA family protein n=1 Tax=Streptomyces sp. NPDC058758 TaxID=3346627 RepID=UPI0036A1D7CD